jgi:hypothetical protein
LHRLFVVDRNAVMVALQAGVFQPKLVHIRAAADGRQQVAEMLGVLVAVGVLAGDGQAIALLLDLDHLGFEAHVQFVGHGAARHVQHLRIAELRHAAATAEDGHAHAERCSACPSSSPITPVPATATDSGKSSQ